MREWRFTTAVIEWRGPAPFYYAPLPDEVAAAIAQVKRQASYGWGVIPLNAKIGGTAFETSLFPRDGTYLLPLKNAVRKPLNITVGDTVAVTLSIGGRIREPDL